MRSLLVLLSLVYLVSASPVQGPKYDHTLKQSVDDFVKLVQWNKIIPIVMDAINNDDQVKEAMNFMGGPQFRKIVVTVDAMKDYQDTLKTIYDLGLDVYYYINALHDIFGIPDIPTPSPNGHKNIRHKRSLIGFFDKLKDNLPLEEFSKLYADKMKHDDVFIAAINAIETPQFNHIGDIVQDMPEWAELLKRLEAKGVDTKKLLAIIKHFFHWH